MKKGIGLGIKTTMISFVILIGIIVMGGLLVLNMYKMGKDMGAIKDTQLHHMTKALELADQLGDMQLALERYIAGDKEQKNHFEKYYKLVEAELTVLGQIPETSKFYGEVEQIRVLKETYYTEAQKIFADFDPSKQREASTTISELIKGESTQLEEVLETYKASVIEKAAREGSAIVLKNSYISKVNILGELIAEAGDMDANLVTFTSGGGLTLADFEEDSETFEARYKQLAAYVEEDEKTTYETIGKLYTIVDATSHDVFNTYNPEAKVQAEVIAQDIYTNTYTKINQHASNLSYGTKEGVMEQLEKEVKNMTAIMVILGVAIVIVAVLVVISALIIQRVVIRPITQLSLTMQDIGEGEGNLTVRIPMKSKDEIGILIYYFNQFVEKIHHMVEKVIADTATLYEASNQINTIVKEAEEAMGGIGTTIHYVTQRLQENASVVEETTASIQEIASSGTVVSEKTEEVSRSSEDVRLAAKAGESKLGQVTKGFTEVQEASEAIQNHLEGLVIYSKNIEQVLGLITGISDQVNLLALNASIEAARAGEYGLGFAVVAEEIRKLAEESRMSAVKIGGIINQVTTKTKEVSKAVEKEHTYISESRHIVAETEVAFNKIVDTVDQVAKEMSHVAEVVTSQSHATDEISQAINEMSVSTQENASAVTKMNDYVATQVIRLKDIEDNMRAFNQLFNELMEQTSKFKV